MLQPEPPLVALMSFGHGVPSSGEDMPEFYESISGDWTDVDAVCTVVYWDCSSPCHTN